MHDDLKAVCLIIKECCRQLEFDPGLRQFSFSLKPGCAGKWERMKSELRSLYPGFSRDRFNEVLSGLTGLNMRYAVHHLPGGIADADLLPGETVEITLDKGQLALTKMGQAQYLSTSGRGMTFGSGLRFERDSALRTSEGEALGVIENVALRVPQTIHVCASALVMPQYFRKPVAASLWELYELARRIRQDESGAMPLIEMAEGMGLDIRATLAIINSFTS